MEIGTHSEPLPPIVHPLTAKSPAQEGEGDQSILRTPGGVKKCRWNAAGDCDDNGLDTSLAGIVSACEGEVMEH